VNKNDKLGNKKAHVTGWAFLSKKKWRECPSSSNFIPLAFYIAYSMQLASDKQ